MTRSNDSKPLLQERVVDGGRTYLVSAAHFDGPYRVIIEDGSDGPKKELTFTKDELVSGVQGHPELGKIIETAVKSGEGLANIMKFAKPKPPKDSEKPEKRGLFGRRAA